MNELQNNIINTSIINILNSKQKVEVMEEIIEIVKDNSNEEIEDLKFRNKVLTVALIGITFMALLALLV
jgi:hypothetical protein